MRPDWAEALAGHRFMARNSAGRMGCRGCTWTTRLTPGTDRAWAAYAAHLAAVLDAALDAWLGADETRERVWDVLDEHGHNGIDCRPRSGFDLTIAAVLATLTDRSTP